MTAFGYSIAQAKTLFFTGPLVAGLRKEEKAALSKFGAYVRTTARNSIRRRKHKSNPGQAPTNWSGLLKRNIFFAYDPAARSVVIGPAKLSGPRQTAIGMTGPQLMEEGGRATITPFKRRNGGRTRRTVRIQARPFMGPAFKANLEHAEKVWAGNF